METLPWDLPGYQFRVEGMMMPPLSAEQEATEKIGKRFITDVLAFHRSEWRLWDSDCKEVCDRCERQYAVYECFGCCGCTNGGGDLYVVFCKDCYDLYCDLTKKSQVNVKDEIEVKHKDVKCK